MQDDDAATGTIKGRSGLVLTEETFTLTNTVEFGADGNAIEIKDAEVTAGAQKAMRFTPTDNTTYAFVYTKGDPTTITTTEIYQPVTKAKGASVAGLYRWGLKNAPAGDVKEGVKYFTGANTDMVEVFYGQTVSNLYLDDQGTTIASGYAVTGTTYYYTVNGGQSYTAAHNVNYADFNGSLFVEGTTPGTYVANTDNTPQDGTAYYYKNGNDYIYCVILPQQTNGTTQLKVFKNPSDQLARVACGDSDVAYEGWEYFDKYTKNDGEYYTKVIKVQ